MKIIPDQPAGRHSNITLSGKRALYVGLRRSFPASMQVGSDCLMCKDDVYSVNAPSNKISSLASKKKWKCGSNCLINILKLIQQEHNSSF